MSGKLTRTLLGKLNPGVFGAVAQAMRDQAQKIEPEQSQFSHRLRFPGDGGEWTGAASDALQARADGFRKTYTEDHTRLIDGAKDCELGKDYLFEGKRAAQSQIEKTEAEHRGYEVDGKYWDCGQPFTVADDFTVQVKPGALPSGAPVGLYNLLLIEARTEEESVKRVVTHLEELGSTWGAKVQQAIDVSHLALDSHGQPFPASPHAHATADGIADGTIPLPKDPKVMEELWSRLLPEEKDKIFGRYPHVCDMDGIPATDKDHYNRVTLDNEVTDKQHALQRVQDEHKDWNAERPPDRLTTGEMHAWEAWSARVKDAQQSLQRDVDFRNTLAPRRDSAGNVMQGGERYLLMHDGKGHASVATGNPDTAQNTTVYVPGTGAHLNEFGGGMSRCDSMFDSAVKAGSPPDKTSVINWYGYDAPDWVAENNPSTSEAARAGAPVLDSFLDGLRATHEGDPSHTTVVAHSYGTAVVGEAATHGNTLNADEVIYAGSPGTDVGHVTDMSLTGVSREQVSAHIFAAADISDPVPRAAEVPIIHGPFGLPILVPPGGVLGPLGEPAHGPAPTDPGFGLPKSQIIDVDPHPGTHAHSEYWDRTPGKDSAWREMGKIIAQGRK
jgi:hypothetical protein